ncbi:hypothetical protein F1880_006746 [Penicillium rolfsii]|nr:hypothetical protein F1880_006746 [Penicillium rolfsii]
MASSHHPGGSKPNSGQEEVRSRRSKRTTALAKQRKEEILRQIPRLELSQAYGDEKAEHDATKAMASRLNLQHNDLVTRLDEAETAVLKTEFRASENEKQIIKLQESLSKSRIAAQNNETWIELMVDENQRLEEANARMVSRAAEREGELNQEIELMEERARQLEQTLSIAYKDVEEYGILYQKNTEDWAELGRFLDEHMSEDNERIQELRSSVMEYSDSMDHFHDEINRLFQAAEVKIARNRLRRDKSARSVGREGGLQGSQVCGFYFEDMHHSLMPLESSKSDGGSLSDQGSSTWNGISCEEHIESYKPDDAPQQIKKPRVVPIKPTESSDEELEATHDEPESLDSLALFVDDVHNGFAVFSVTEKRRRSGSARSDDLNSSLDFSDDRDQIRLYEHFLQDWEENSVDSQDLDGPYGSEKFRRPWERIHTDGISSPESTYSESFLGRSWSVPSPSDPTSSSGLLLSSLGSESWNYIQEQQPPLEIIQKRRKIDRSRLQLSPVDGEYLSNQYIPPLNTSRKRIRLAPPAPDSIAGSYNESNNPSTASSDIGVQVSIEATDCEVPQSVSGNRILNDDWIQSSFTMDQQQGKSITGRCQSRGIQTDGDPLVACLGNSAASSLQEFNLAPTGPLSPRCKRRSLSVGDLPRILVADGATPFKRMPGSWPRETISHADVKPIVASDMADAVLRMLKTSVEYAVPFGIKVLHLLSPAHPKCIVYPILLVLWLWQTYEDHLEWERWERANERYFVQQLRNRYASQTDWVESMSFGLTQWLEFDRSSFG